MTYGFQMGQCVITPGAGEFLRDNNMFPLTLLNRHVCGDWGNLCDEDIASNEDALKYGGRIFSSYIINNEKIWIITEADRSATTILLPEEY